eukprot:1741-Heterococcus_DN1.PRE.2
MSNFKANASSASMVHIDSNLAVAIQSTSSECCVSDASKVRRCVLDGTVVPSVQTVVSAVVRIMYEHIIDTLSIFMQVTHTHTFVGVASS